MSSRWVILYTSEKHKKKKRWFDGQLQVLPCGKRGAIFDDKGDRIFTFFLRKKDSLFNGAEINAERYLLQIEEEIIITPIKTTNHQHRKLIDYIEMIPFHRYR